MIKSRLEELEQFYDDPYGFVLYAFDWDVIKPNVHPSDYLEAWQADILDTLGREVKAKNYPIRIATVSGHGVGKTALVAMIICWIMFTRPNAKGIVTATTIPQLETKTWAELAKWLKKSCAKDYFDITTGKGSMKMLAKGHEESWRCDAQTSREGNSESFAGLHALDSTAFYIFDEASGVPEEIWEVAEGGLTDGEPMILVFGNGTSNVGKFKECFDIDNPLWITRKVDSREVTMTNKEMYKQWSSYYGEDSDFMRVRVYGEFPLKAVNQFIPTDLAYERSKKPLDEYVGGGGLIAGLDVARGGNDSSVLAIRDGRNARQKWYKWNFPDSMILADTVSELYLTVKWKVLFIDGGGIGGPVYDRLMQLGLPNVIPIDFGSGSNKRGYANKRAQMWGDLKRWLEQGGFIPDDKELVKELISVQYRFKATNNDLILEEKEKLKKSPDSGDALALTFAQDVNFGNNDVNGVDHHVITDYNVYDTNN